MSEAVRRRLDPCVAQVAAALRDQGRGLVPDLDAAGGFLRLLDPEAGFFSFRTFSDTPYTRQPGRDPLELELHGGLDLCAAELTELNRAGAAVCVTVNATNGRGRGPRDIVAVRALYLDADRGAQASSPFAEPPHLTVESSPGHRHHYWRVRGLSPKELLPLLHGLARRGGGDGRACALNQALRLPGFWHRKEPSRPFRVRLVEAIGSAPLDRAAARRLAGMSCFDAEWGRGRPDA